MKLIPTSLEQIFQSKAYTLVVLMACGKKFGIYTEASVGKILKKLLLQESFARPMTHDLIGSILEGLHVGLKQVVIYKVEETLYFARIFLEQQCGETTQIVQIETRPSDALILSLMYGSALYCSDQVFNEALSLEQDLLE